MEEVYAGKKSLKERMRVCQRKEKERVEREESGEKWLIGERAKHFARPSVLFLASCFLLLASTPNSDAFFFFFCFCFSACGQPLSPLFDDSFRRADTPRQHKVVQKFARDSTKQKGVTNGAKDTAKLRQPRLAGCIVCPMQRKRLGEESDVFFSFAVFACCLRVTQKKRREPRELEEGAVRSGFGRAKQRSGGEDDGMSGAKKWCFRGGDNKTCVATPRLTSSLSFSHTTNSVTQEAKSLLLCEGVSV